MCGTVHNVLVCCLCTYSTQNAAYLLVDLCQLPAKTGPCKARMRRWYYDTKKKRCVVFVYGGCRGNANNFMSSKSCVKRCVKPNEGSSSLPSKFNEISDKLLLHKK